MKLSDSGSIDRIDRPVAQCGHRMPPKKTLIFGDGASLDFVAVLFQESVHHVRETEDRPLLLSHDGEVFAGRYLAEHALCLLPRGIWRPWPPWVPIVNQ